MSIKGLLSGQRGLEMVREIQYRHRHTGVKGRGEGHESMYSCESDSDGRGVKTCTGHGSTTEV